MEMASKRYVKSLIVSDEVRGRVNILWRLPGALDGAHNQTVSQIELTEKPRAGSAPVADCLKQKRT